MLLLATVVAGVVDAVSFLGLGRVFVANMTGNVVFVGFGIASAPGISVTRSLVAIASFLVGSAAGAALARRMRTRRRSWLPTAFGLETACLLAALGLDRSSLAGGRHLALIVPMALGMGMQNATAAELALPDLTTTVLTRTLTTFAGNLRFSHLDLMKLGRPALAVAAMLAGATFGALLVLRVDLAAGIALAVGILLAISALGLLAEEAQDARRGSSLGDATHRCYL
jgi:uncharacterized membrane protein YoaK (UPF0700 family)